jgi:hypothetical protein
MGEARRRKLAGICKPPPQPLSRADAIAWAWGILVAAEGGSVSGITILPADGSEPVYLSADDAKRTPGRKH